MVNRPVKYPVELIAILFSLTPLDFVISSLKPYSAFVYIVPMKYGRN